MNVVGNIVAWTGEWLTGDDSGRRFVPPPWDNLDDAQRRQVPFVARFRPAPARWLLSTGFLCILAGWLFAVNTLVAIGVALATTVWLAFREARRLCGDLDVSVAAVPSQVFEKESFSLVLSVHNQASVRRGPVTLRLLFSGASRPEHYVIIPVLSPYERRKLTVPLLPDIGMGHYALGSFVVAARDPLGLFTLCVAVDDAAQIEVLPLAHQMTPFELRGASLSRRPGQIPQTSGGGGGAFLGLRPYQTGDSIRHIDWKRSQRHGDLLVKEFEATATTAATLFVDQGILGHCGFQNVSTLESMRDSVLALAHSLLAQQISVQLVASDHVVGPGVGSGQLEAITEVVKGLRARSDADFRRLLDQHLPSVPPHALAVLFFCTGNLTTDDLWPALLALADRRTEAVLVGFDSRAFERVVKQAAGLTEDAEVGAADLLTAALRRDRQRDDPVARVAASAAERTFLIRPGQSLADVYVR